MAANHFVASHYGKRHYIGLHFPPPGGAVENNSGGWDDHPFLRPLEVYADEIEGAISQPIVVEMDDRAVALKPGPRPTVAEALVRSELRVRRIQASHTGLSHEDASEAVWNILQAERVILATRARMFRDDNELITILIAAGEL